MPIMNSFVDETAESEVVQSLVEEREWMKSKNYELIDTVDALDKFIEDACEVGECSLDLETDGLNTGPDQRGRGSRVAQIAGFCMAHHEDHGVYVPVNHRCGQNIPLSVVIPKIKKLIASCKTVYHNFKFDGELLRNEGIVIEDIEKIEDTMLATAILMAERPNKGLKGLSKDLLGKEMIELSSIVPNKSNIDFCELHPKVALYYAASDAVITLELWHELKRRLIDTDPNNNNGTRFLYNVEKGCQFAVMAMERHLVKVDVHHYQTAANKIKVRLDELEDEIYKESGGPFDMASNKQLGELLFDKLAIPYPMKEKSKTGDYFVKKEVLEKIADKHPIPKKILELRALEKLYTTYLINLLKNHDETDHIKVQLNQIAADSGRFSSRGGKGITHDGYSGVNVQNIPAVKKGDIWQLRKGIKARDGYQICAIDYSGEELRIATNLSKEPVWTREFNEGEGDIHSITASLLFGGTPVEMARAENKAKRGIAKTANFLIVYGGSAGTLSSSARIPLAQAQQHMDNYFKGLDKLSEWMAVERIRAKRRGYSLSAFGRRRGLADLYNSGDRGLAAKADRLAVNAAVQGTGADIIKIAMYKVWRYLRDNDMGDIVRPLFPVHDEIVYEIKTEHLDTMIPILSNIMKLEEYTSQLGWEVKLDVDAEYGDNFMVSNDFYKDLEKNITASVRLGMIDSGDEGATPSSTKTAEAVEALDKPAEDTPTETPSSPPEETKEIDTIKAPELPPDPTVSTTPPVEIEGEFFNFEVQKTDSLSKAHSNMIWEVLEGIDEVCTGTKKRIRLTKDNKVIHTTKKTYTVDGFLALAYNYSI